MGLMARLRWLLLGVLGVVSAGLLPGVASAAGCANETLRTGYSANLPDCRAYEMVSPVDKKGGSVNQYTLVELWRSSVDGNRMAFSSSQPFADSQTGEAAVDYYVASRGGEGWSTHALLPPQAPVNAIPLLRIFAFSPDLSSYAFEIGGESSQGQDDPPLVAGEPAATRNLFVRSTDSGASQLVDVTPPGVTPPRSSVSFEGAAPDLSRVFFAEEAKLTPDALEGSRNLYEWSGGKVTLTSFGPGGNPLGYEVGSLVQDVSRDGSRVIFQAENCGLCLRETAARRTVRIDASQGPGITGTSVTRTQFEAASADGSRIFFSALASGGLTNDTSTGGDPETNVNLYEYDVATGKLTDLTPDSEANVGNGTAGGGVLGVSDDGSYVYFVAGGVLAPGGTAGQPNLYLWHEGSTSFVATLEEGEGEFGDGGDWHQHLFDAHQTSRVTPDGLHLAFMSMRSLTGYDNTDANTGVRDHEVYLYDAVTRSLVCASCNPSGARPLGSSNLNIIEDSGYVLRASSNVLAPEPLRMLSADGSRMFFDSEDALVPQDTNGSRDVYEYESGGGVRLISSGTSAGESSFLDASVNGSDVFFFTSQPLVGRDIDQSSDVYDARVGGGFAEPSSPVVCGGEGCRGAPAGAPVSGVPGSVTFSGQGNLVPAVAPVVSVPKAKKPRPKAKVRRKRRKRVRGRRSAHGARGGHSTGKRG
jgi:Tol biopolymer transport system component